jgi:hypothetical protein
VVAALSRLADGDLVALLVHSCAHADDAPDWAVRVTAEAHKRVVIPETHWYARDFRYVPAGQTAWETAPRLRRPQGCWRCRPGTAVRSSRTVPGVLWRSWMGGSLIRWPMKRIHPFDTGAFDRGRMPDYLTTFKVDDFNVGTDQDQIGRLISLYFETSRRYVDRNANDQKKLKDEHLLTMSHAKVLAVAKLYKEGSTKNYDDRAAAIELQIEEDIPLKKENLLGVVVPEEYTRTPGVRESLKELTNVVETYRLLPLSISQHYGLIYDCVEKVYKRAGINL